MDSASRWDGPRDGLGLVMDFSAKLGGIRDGLGLVKFIGNRHPYSKAFRGTFFGNAGPGEDNLTAPGPPIPILHT